MLILINNCMLFWPLLKGQIRAKKLPLLRGKIQAKSDRYSEGKLA